jgi:hypothetical protein
LEILVLTDALKPRSLLGFYARLKSCPDTKHRPERSGS